MHMYITLITGTSVYPVMNPTCCTYTLQSLQLHLSPFQHLICFLKIGRVLESFISCGNSCHILLPRKAIVSIPKDVVRTFGTCASVPCLNSQPVFRCVKISFIKVGFRYIFVLKISVISNCRFLIWMGTELVCSRRKPKSCS